jgi:2-aminoadipate transaminase
MRSLLSHRALGATSSAIRDLLRLTEQPGILSLAGGLPAAASFPTAALRDQAVKVLADDGPYGPQALQYGRTEGVTELREVVAARSGEDPSAVVITTGSQQALDLIGRCLIDPGDVVVVESPSYIGALQALRAYDPAFEPIPGDHAGIDTDLLETRLRAGLRPTLCYVVSNFANPTGASLSLDRRVHLLALAQEFGFLVVEDDPYGELRFRGEFVPSIRSLAGAAQHVASVRTVSKTVAPGLRVGWAVLPEWLFDPVVVAKQAVDLHTSTVAQFLALGLLADEEAHAARVRETSARYGRQAEALTSALQRNVGDAIDLSAVDGGMFLWGRFVDPSVDTSELLVAALRHGVAFVPGAAFYASRPGDMEPVPHSYLRMSFATLSADRFDEAAKRLGAAIAG